MSKMKRSHKLFLFFIFLIALACGREKGAGTGQITLLHTPVILLDSLSAANTILNDGPDRFFEQITPLDMAIQLRRDVQARPVLLEKYREDLQQSVRSFSAAEADYLSRVFEQVNEFIAPLGSLILPDTLQLLKVSGTHYGSSAYYTRGSSIIIPAAELTKKNIAGHVRVLLHELFHIYSRQHPEEREALYRLISFHPLELPLEFPDSLASRLLLNPDGTRLDYAITLDTVLAIPLIYSKYATPEPSTKRYFDYLDFRLYPVIRVGERYEVQVVDGYRSPLPPAAELPLFWQQIGDNTNYIIHPDEILADNFVLLARIRAEASRWTDFSPEGQDLLRQMDELFQSFNK